MTVSEQTSNVGRGDAADARFLRVVMRLAADECATVAAAIRATANPNNVIAIDLIARLNRITRSLRTGAGPDPEHPELDFLYAEPPGEEEIDVEQESGL
jgi:hypothetical protein